MTIADGSAPGVLAWLMSYAIHSTILLAGAWAFTRYRNVLPATADIIWKSAMLGGLLTATVQTQFNVRPGAFITLADAVAPPSVSSTTAPTPPAQVDPGEMPDGGSAPAFRTSPALSTSLPSGTAIAVTGWAMLALVLAIGYTARRLILVGRLGDRQPLPDGPLAVALQSLQRRAGVRRRVHLTTSRAISSPVALGLSEICLPEAAVTDLDEDQQHSMLAHELAHLIRRDPVWLEVASMMERIFFFQPLNRRARREMQAAAEYLCDDWAARHAGSGVPLARCLAKVAEWIQASPLGLPVAGMAEQRSLLVSRIARLIDGRTNGAPRSRPAMLALAGAVLAAMVIVAPRVSGREVDEEVDTAWHAGEQSPGEAAAAALDSSVGARDDLEGSSQASTGSGAVATGGSTKEDTVVVNALIARLKDEDAQVRRAAAHSLGRLEDPRAIPALIAVFRDGDPEVRAAAADAISSFEDPRTIGPLADLLGDANTEVRQNALSALSHFEKGVPAGPVMRLLDDPEEGVRHEAAHLLGHIGDRAATAPLARLVRDGSAEVRAAALESLAELGDPSVGSAVLAALGDQNPEVRQAALHALDQLKVAIPEAAFMALLRDSSSDVRSTAAGIAGERSIVAAVPVLRRLLDDPSGDVRESAVDALGEIVDPSAREALRSALNSQDARVRRRAAEALGDRDQ